MEQHTSASQQCVPAAGARMTQSAAAQAPLTAARWSAGVRLLDEGLLGRGDSLLSGNGRARLQRLQQSWDLAQEAIALRKDFLNMPLSAAPQVSRWCVLLALELIDADAEFARSRRAPPMRHPELWARLRNLRMGLGVDGRQLHRLRA